MRLSDCAKLARGLLAEHGHSDIQFVISYTALPQNLKGYTAFKDNDACAVILNGHYVELLPEAEIAEIVRHEIAHVRAGKEAAHGPVWEAEAIALGIEPVAIKRASVRPTFALKGA